MRIRPRKLKFTLSSIIRAVVVQTEERRVLVATARSHRRAGQEGQAVSDHFLEARRCAIDERSDLFNRDLWFVPPRRRSRWDESLSQKAIPATALRLLRGLGTGARVSIHASGHSPRALIPRRRQAMWIFATTAARTAWISPGSHRMVLDDDPLAPACAERTGHR